MVSVLAPFFDMLDAEFDGKSWNGLSLMATLDKLSAVEACSIKTWEGYSAWEIAIHCAKSKYMIAKDLGASLPQWSFPGEGWFVQPVEKTEDAWARDKAYFKTIHSACLKALRAMAVDQLEKEMPSWKCPYGEAIAWLCNHDSFHGAQIRSMGLPSLREPRK